MDIRQLEYFIAVAQRGSFTKAANELFLSRQALSKAVRNLEHELGVTLFTTKENRLELTSEGHRLHEDAQPVVQQFCELEHRYACGNRGGEIKRSLSVAIVHGAAITLPKRAINTFRAEHPDILLSIEEASTDTALTMVRDGETDISLVGSVPRYLDQFDIALVVETGMNVFVPPASPLHDRKRLTLADLDGQPFITFGKRDHLHRFFVEACEEANVHPDIVLTSSNKDLLLRTAHEQDAFYFGFPARLNASGSQTTDPLPVDLGRDDLFGTYAIKKKGVALSTSARAFWEFLQSL